jgi:hypothetical protein
MTVIGSGICKSGVIEGYSKMSFPYILVIEKE